MTLLRKLNGKGERNKAYGVLDSLVNKAYIYKHSWMIPALSPSRKPSHVRRPFSFFAIYLGINIILVNFSR